MMKKIVVALSIFIGMGCGSKAEEGQALGDSTRQFEQTYVTDQDTEKSASVDSEGKVMVIHKVDDDGIGFVEVMAVMGFITGFLGFALSYLLLKKLSRIRAKDNRDYGKIISEVIEHNVSVRQVIAKVIRSELTENRTNRQVLNRADIDFAVDEYVKTKKFHTLLQTVIANQLSEAIERSKEVKKEDHVNPFKLKQLQVEAAVQRSYFLYAKESKDKVLTNLQESYQKGKSIYKLVMNEPNASKAVLDICIEQEEVKQRILKFDSQYLEPICEVRRLTNTPTEVVVTSTGVAEREKDNWIVVKSIIIELK